MKRFALPLLALRLAVPLPHKLNPVPVLSRPGVAVEPGRVPGPPAGRSPAQLHRAVERRHGHQAVEEKLRREHPVLLL